MADSDQKAQTEAHKRQREVEQAFAVVFGSDTKRSAEQQIVWAHLMSAGFLDRPIIRLPFDPTQIAADAANHDLIVKVRELVARGNTPDNPGNFPVVGSVRE